MVASDERPTAPRFDAAEADDIKVFYHNLAYRVNRQVINQVKLQILQDRLAECARREGVNHLEKCEQLSKHFQAIARVSALNAGPANNKRRNVGNVYGQQQQPAEA